MNGSARRGRWVAARCASALVVAGVWMAACGGEPDGPASPDPLPLPSLDRIEPNLLVASEVGATIRAMGDGFGASSRILWNGGTLVTRMLDPGVLEGDIPAGRLTSGGEGVIAVWNPTPGGGMSGTAALTVVFPEPVLDSIVPDTVLLNSGLTEIAVHGSGFVRGAEPSGLRVGPGLVPKGWVRHVSPRELRLYMPSELMGYVFDADIAVENATPGGGRSDWLPFSVVYGLPTILRVEPAAIVAGSTLELRVHARDVAPGAVIRWNGRDLVSERWNVNDEHELRAILDAQDTATLGEVRVTIWNPGPRGGESAAIHITVR